MIKALAQVARAHDILAIQELHGDNLDAKEFEAMHPDLILYYSAGDNCDSGGTGIIISKSFAQLFSSIYLQTI